ncbi:hypothetical protein B0919_06215 [Hymenobacter sp. CRA2]|nr:hypothetical protein B0919_06215 [Hymenobacter sp. CRA2]
MRFTPAFAGLPRHALNVVSPASAVRRLVKVLGYTGLRLVGNIFRPVPQPEPLAGRVWLYVLSQNNYDALHFLRAHRPDAAMVAGQSKQIGRYNGQVGRLSLRGKLLYYWQFPVVFWGLWRQHGSLAWRFFDLIYNAIGYYEEYRRALRRYRPRAVVFANDHNDDARAMLLACQAEGVPTAYIQHASVSTIFPPLGFDLNLLEGQDALDKYRQCGPVAGQVQLVGMPKADAFVGQRNTNPVVRRVAIATNILDPTEGIAAAVQHLSAQFPELQFTLRPHPNDQRDFAQLLRPYPRVQLSDARRENVFAFLAAHDALVAADTSTHLEATLLNLASIYYRFGSTGGSFDYYGYAAHGLVDYAPALPDIDALLTRYQQGKPADLYLKAGYYNATLGTPHEGHSQQLALAVLDQWLSS